MRDRGAVQRRNQRLVPIITSLAFLPLLVACGGGNTGNTVNWYVFKEPGGAYDQAAATCSQASGGRYQIRIRDLPTSADTQREQLVRRLAAKDASVDVLGMDVIWTGEFAEAGWIKPFTPEQAAEISRGVLAGPLQTATYEGRLYAAPSTSNTQLLWYRKDRVKKPPEDFDWNQMIDEASREGKAIEVQGKQYEGLSVWVNALIAGGGGQIVNEDGDVKVNVTAKQAGAIMKKLATSKAAPPGLTTAAEDQARIGFESDRSNYEVNYTFIYASAAEKKGFQEKIGWARYPRTDAGKPSRPPLGGINVGVGAFSKKKDLAFEAAECLAQPKNQVVAAEKGGLPPTTESVYEDPKLEKAFPFADLLRESINEGAPRPVTPAYSDISLAIQRTYHPEAEIDVNTVESKLKDRLEKAAKGEIF
jgi:multiple sugar transport system substrate-binding protein